MMIIINHPMKSRNGKNAFVPPDKAEARFMKINGFSLVRKCM